MKSRNKLFALAFAAAVTAACAKTVVPYGDAPEQRGDLYLPDTVSAATPKLLLIHGGGWRSEKYQRGTLDDESELFRRAGYAVYNIDYRLAPKAPWPAPGDDCLAAARTFVACAGMPSLAAVAGRPVFVMGLSAGGHLALMTGLRLPRKDVLGIVSVSGIADPGPDAKEHPDRYADLFAGGARDPAAFPAAHLSDDTPPVLFTHCRNDTVVPIASAISLARTLADRGLPAETYFYDLGRKGEGHAMWDAANKKSHVLYGDIQARCLAFMRAVRGLPEPPAGGVAPAFAVDADIPAGNAIVTAVEGDRVSLRQDLRGTKDSWFYWAFRVKGAAGKTVRFVFTDKHGGGPVGVRGPVVSKDGGKTFAYPLDGKSKPDGFTYTFGPDENETLFYECHPYVRADWDAFVARHAADAAKGRMSVETLCRSRAGAEVPRVRAGALGGGPRHRFLFTARHHCSETMASWALEGVVDAFLADDELGEWLRANVELMAVPFVDYDGAQAGDQGKYRLPHDHNRDYSAFIYPETKALAEWVEGHAGGRLDAFVDLHCPWIRGDYNEFVYATRKDPKIVPATVREDRFSEILEKVQSGALAYRAAHDLPFGQRWNKGINYDQGWSSVIWACRNVKGLKVCRAMEIPFANASGVVVTPERCRAFGRDLACALRALLTE